MASNLASVQVGKFEDKHEGEEDTTTATANDDDGVEQVEEEQVNEEEEEEEEEEERLIEFMDSLDTYLYLINSLSSTLQKGWLELASARQSMGSSRVSSSLLDLSEHSAQTTFNLFTHPGGHPHFVLNKWGSSSTENKLDGDTLQQLLAKPDLRLRRRTSNQHAQVEKNGSTGLLLPAADDQVQQKRSKSLSVFGGLVSPKLRAGQLSFETALEILADIANMRSSMISAYDQVRNEVANINTCQH